MIHKFFLMLLPIAIIGTFDSCTKENPETTTHSILLKNDAKKALSFSKVCLDLEQTGAVETLADTEHIKSLSQKFSNFSSVKAFEINNQTHVILSWASANSSDFKAAADTCNKQYSDITEEDGTSHKICSGSGSECRVTTDGVGTTTIIVCTEKQRALNDVCSFFIF